MNLKNNIFIGIYFLMTCLYIYFNEKVYYNIMKPIAIWGFILVLICIVYSLISKRRFTKTYIILNVAIIVVLVIIFIFNYPKFSYTDAQKMILEEKRGLGQIIEVTDNNYTNRIGIGHLNTKPNRNILIKGDYIVYFYNNSTENVEWYRFNAIDGTYKLYDTK